METTVNQRIKDYIKIKGIKYTEIAVAVGLSNPNLHRLLSSDDIKVSMLVKFCKALNVDMDYFIEGKSNLLAEKKFALTKSKNKLEKLNQFLITLNKTLNQLPEKQQKQITSIFNEFDLETLNMEIKKINTVNNHLKSIGLSELPVPDKSNNNQDLIQKTLLNQSDLTQLIWLIEHALQQNQEE
ncbi:MAG: helix-turn-helix domain-containing protein [Bacteroidota bacterium]